MRSAILVLGSPNDEDGRLLPIALSRCKTALSEFNRKTDCKILCTGGFGQHFNATKLPHGKYLQNHLENQGIPSSSFLEIALSAFTIEDATLSKPILISKNMTDIVLVTSDFHMPRAKMVFTHVFPTMNFNYAMANTVVSKDEYHRLELHEKMAFTRDRSTLENFDSL